MRCFYCFWSQRKLSCVSFNPITRFFIFTLRLSAPLSRSFTPSSAQGSLPHELGARVFLRMQADSPEPTWPEPSLPEKTPTEWIEPLTSEHSAILHPPTTGTHTHTHTFTFSLACHNKMPPKSLALPNESLSSVTAFGHQLASHDVSENVKPIGSDRNSLREAEKVSRRLHSLLEPQVSRERRWFPSSDGGHCLSRC